MEREIAIAIGHHFWDCDTDEAAARNGADAARDVMKRLGDMDRRDEIYSANACRECGWPIADGETICGECACEEDGV